MTPIGARNPAVQHLRRLSRRRSARQDTQSFVIEGPVLVQEAMDAGVELEALFVEPGADAWADPICDRARRDGVRCLEVADGVLAGATDTVTPQPMAAVARMRDRPQGFFTSTVTGLVVVLGGVGDPGNAGTILRSAEAAGAKGVIAPAGSVDLYSPKVVRASAGSLFRLPHASTDESTREVLVALGAAGYGIVGTIAANGVPYDRADLTAPLALALGNERHGLEGVDDVVTTWLTIPMATGVESLNVAMAATVICFEAARQRRSGREQARGSAFDASRAPRRD